MTKSGNKEELIKFISRRFEECGIEITIFEDNADVEIVKKAIQIPQRPEEVAVSLDDTDTLVLLLYHCQEDFVKYISVQRLEKKRRKQNY